MTSPSFDHKLETARQWLSTLEQWVHHPAETAPPPELFVEALTQLATTMEELQVVEEELRQQNEALAVALKDVEVERRRYQELFDFAPDGYLVTDVEGVIQEVNRAAASLFQKRQDFLLGKPLVVFVAAEDRWAFSTWLLQLRRQQDQQAHSRELRFQSQDGAYFFTVLTAAPIRDARDQLVSLRWLLRDISGRKQVEAEKEQLVGALYQQREQLRALARRLTEIQEAERKQLARELHDQVGQSLTALDFNLNFIAAQLAKTSREDGPAQSRLDDSLALVAGLGERIRDVMADLRPPLLDDYGVMEALHWYAGQLASRVNFTLTVQGEEPAPRLAAPLENALFRIAQESLTNITKHAQASQATVTLEANDERVRLVIVDNGIGFEPASLAELPSHQHWGLLTMTERAQAVGGRCSINSRPGQGTQIIVEVSR